MKLNITHKTTYHYDTPVHFALQQLRLTPKTRPGQKVLDWQVHITGGTKQLEFEDHHHNQVQLVSVEPGSETVEIVASGLVETNDQAGVLGRHGGFAPLWYFKRQTELTRPGKGVDKLLKSTSKKFTGDTASLHKLSAKIRKQVSYEPGYTDSATTAEEAVIRGRGVCQDHSHIFLSAVRKLGLPARYVSGYLMMNDQVEQDATHAWTEVHVDGLGWVGFDISNGISPDEKYVPVATGLDYLETAPISGVRFGDGVEMLDVSVQVQQ